MNIAIVLIAGLVAGVLSFAPRVRGSSAWRATVTPLSSIMGSGFLVSAPLVAAVAGAWAPFAMAALLALSYGLGAMIRFNIRYAEPVLDDGPPDREHRLHRGHRDRSGLSWELPQRTITVTLEKASHVVLAGAYVVSVSYYLQLLAAFVLNHFGVQDDLGNRMVASGILAVIGLLGALWGLRAIERVETYAVSFNLGMIAALVTGLLLHAITSAADGTLSLPHIDRHGSFLHGLRVMMGLLIIVQGFETSRFLGAEHSSEERIGTMRAAQWLSAAIYLSFVTLVLPLLDGGLEADVTAIVGLVAPVASVLPLLIVLAAIGSQFSAAVADDAGCAGLLGTITRNRIPTRWLYVAIALLAVALTWLTNVMSIISLASRAFALFYAFQCAVTASTAYRRPEAEHRGLHMVGGAAFAIIALAVTVFGIPAE
jgi:hypothetical protein